QEADAGGPAPDAALGWLAFEQGTGAADGLAWEATSTDARFDHTADRLDFDQDFDAAPLVLASLSSFTGGDPAALRQADLDARGVALQVMEERSLDEETGHVAEQVDVLAFDGAGLLYAQAWDALA
ncbi:MAG: hypothetical protein AAFZ09_13970, partial [Pseudomonadota bacterium]